MSYNNGNGVFYMVRIEMFRGSREVARVLHWRLWQEDFSAVSWSIYSVKAVARKRVIKIQQAPKVLEGAIVNCKVSKSAIALKLLVVLSVVHKWPINLFINPCSIYSHTNTRDNTICLRVLSSGT
jgi:hypothetical protein